MMLFPPTKMPNLIQQLGNGLIWKIPCKEPTLYLTFDDGPTPQVTSWVLDKLDQYDAKATFFCIGKNVNENPKIYTKIIENGHAIGNHSHDHIKGWNTASGKYLNNVLLASKYIDSKIFRPPYGQLRPSQIQLLKKHFNIIMWSILSKDYSNKIAPDECAKNVLKYASSGDIVVFHDSKKAEQNMRVALEATLSHFSKRGYLFKRIPEAVE